MLGHENQLYNRKFIDSFKKSLTEVLNKENSLNEYTVGPSSKMEPGKGVGQISDLELARRMRETKSTSIFGPSKQTAEYLELEKEQARRTAAKATPAPQTDGMRATGKSTATAFDEPSSAAAKPSGKPSTLFKPEPPVPGLKGQGPGPTPDADIPSKPARRVDFTDPLGLKKAGIGGTTSKTSSINVSDPLKVPEPVKLNASDIRPKGPPTAIKPTAATPPLKMDTAGATDAAKAEFEKASSTPAAMRLAAQYVPGMGQLAKRAVDAGSAQTPRAESGVSVRQVSAGARTPEAEEAFRQASMTPAAMRLRAKSGK